MKKSPIKIRVIRNYPRPFTGVEPYLMNLGRKNLGSFIINPYDEKLEKGFTTVVLYWCPFRSLCTQLVYTIRFLFIT